MQNTYDVIVIGLGGMGSAAAYQLARRGTRVLGLERFGPAHNQGSSHGKSRIIRQAYFEDPAYVPLLLRAYELWEELDRTTAESLLTITGGLMIGPPDSAVISGAQLSAQTHNLPHELLDAAEIRRRFPPFNVPNETIGLYEHRAGFLHPEATVQAHLDQAAHSGAALHFHESAERWEATPGGGVRVTTARGVYEAERVVIAAGAWAPQLLGELGLPLTVERQVLYWFEPPGGREPFGVGRFPIYIWEHAPGDMLYGFPAQDGPPGGVKIAFFYRGAPTAPDQVERSVRPEEIAEMRAALARCIPSLNGTLLETATCLYTLTPDQHFIIAPHPQLPQVIIASPCSGHGYKFASVIGEILADLAMTGSTRHPIALFDPARFGDQAAGGGRP
jgi:sarcosine oxidase